MVPVKVQKISFHPPSRSYAVILTEINGERKLPVIVGSFEAQSIALAMEAMDGKEKLIYYGFFLWTRLETRASWASS